MVNPNDDKKSIITAAINLRKAGKQERSIELLEELIEMDPDYVFAYIQLAITYQIIGKYKEAEKFLLIAQSKEPNNAIVKNLFGLNLFSQQRYLEAIPYLEAQIEDEVINTYAILILYKTLTIILNKENEGLKVLKRALEKIDDIDIEIQLAKHYIKYDKNYNQGIQILKNILEEKETTDILSTIADGYSRIGDYNQAIIYLRKALEIDPKNDEIWRTLSSTYLEKGDFEQALMASEYALSIDPNNYENLTSKGRVLYKKEDYESYLELSERTIQKIISSDDSKEIKELSLIVEFLSRADSLSELGLHEDALKDIERGINLVPDQSILYYSKIDLLMKEKNGEEALGVLKSISDNSINKKLIPIHYRILHALNRKKDAWNLIAPYLEKDTEKFIDELLDEGISLYFEELVEPAISIMEQLLQKAPESNRIKTDLAYILIGEKDYERAENLLIETIRSKNNDIYFQIAICNLAYLYNLVENYKKAENLLSEIISSGLLKDEAILRVSFWYDNEMLPDHIEHPGREISISDAAYGCAISAALANGEFDKAEITLLKYSEDSNDKNLFLIIKGCYELAAKNYEGAENAWRKLLETTASNSDKEKISEWLESMNKE